MPNTPLVPVFTGQIQLQQIQLCNARDLHAFLGVRRVFGTWITDRISEYSFTENDDFLVFTDFGKNPKGGRPRVEYHLSLDMAKELAMVERTDKGRQIRRYFIECERQAKGVISATITPAQQSELQAIVADKSSGNSKHRAMMWSRFNRHFKIARYSQLPVSQFDDAVQYMQAISAFGEPEDETESVDHVQRAYAMAQTVASEVSRMVFDAALDVKEERPQIQSTRWLFGCRFDHKTQQYVYLVQHLHPDACIATLTELAEDIQGAALLPTNDELVRLAKACQSRLMGRAGMTDTH